VLYIGGRGYGLTSAAISQTIPTNIKSRAHG
jgi:hypothetical protein